MLGVSCPSYSDIELDAEAGSETGEDKDEEPPFDEDGNVRGGHDHKHGGASAQRQQIRGGDSCAFVGSGCGMLKAIKLRVFHHVGCCGENAQVGYLRCMCSPLLEGERSTKTSTGFNPISFLDSAVHGELLCCVDDNTISPMVSNVLPVRGNRYTASVQSKRTLCSECIFGYHLDS